MSGGYIVCADDPLPVDPGDCVALIYDEQPFLLLPPLTIEDATSLAPIIMGLFAAAWAIKVIGRFILKPY